VPTPSIETVRAWLGRVMIDRDGNRIGEITDIYLDNETGRPEWAVVRTGLFGLRSTFAPLAEATEVGEQVQIRHQRAQVKDAPSIEPDGQLSQAEEAELYRHYGLDYDAVVADSGPPTGTGIGPAGQVAGPEINERTGTPPAGADQDTRTAIDQPTGTTGAATLAGSPGGGPADTGSHGQPTKLTRQPDSADTDQQDAAGTVEGDLWRRDSRADEAPVAGMTESSRPATQDPFPAGEGMSQPFVYETPGPPEGGSGTRRRQPGQVRLRRYLVTEVVTETESGQRHEVRVEREPINDDEVDAVTGAPGQAGQPVPGEETGPDENDWFRAEGDPRR
jgi:sporulation protein YlmC with PRC-barrel domain